MGENPLAGADAPRPMPDSVRARIEAELLSAAPLPASARKRISTRLADPTGALFEGIDGPRALPAGARRRIERALTPAAPVREPRWLSSRSWLAVAAVATLILASVSAITNRPDPADHGEQVAGPAEERASGQALADGTAGVGDPGFATPGASASPQGATQLDSSTTPLVGATNGSTTARRSHNSPPPFALSDDEATFGDGLAVSSPDSGHGPGAAPTTTTAPPPPPPFRISVARGDATGVAGFNAYVELLNRYGGAGGRRFVIVKDGEPADVSVNLSGTAATTAPAVVRIESPFAPDHVLRGRTFSFAGAIDRQAHLIADAVYPTSASGTAAIYRERSGVLHDEVPAALEAVLRERGLTPVLVDVRANEGVVPVPADSVFLSLTPANAKRVVDAYPASSRPANGFNGVGTLAESASVGNLPVGSRFISPYAFPNSNEARRVQELTRLPPGARLYHGWIAAKTLAVAVWRYDPRSADAVQSSLKKMDGYANGFAPAYSYRPGTNSVRPEGVLFRVEEDGAKQTGDFLTDPRP